MDNCEYCLYYDYDEEYDCYTCSMSLDEDELRLFMEKRFSHWRSSSLCRRPRRTGGVCASSQPSATAASNHRGSQLHTIG